MRESTSPPRTPTPRSGNLTPSSTSTEQGRNDTNNRIPSTSPITVNSTQLNAQQSSTNLFATNGNISVTQLDLEFPKLTPPKSKSPRNNNHNNNNFNNNISINSTNSGSSSSVNRDMDKSTNNSSNGNIGSTSISAPTAVRLTNESNLKVHTGYGQNNKNVCAGNTGNVVTISNGVPSPTSTPLLSPSNSSSTASVTVLPNNDASTSMSIDVPTTNTNCIIQLSVSDKKFKSLQGDQSNYIENGSIDKDSLTEETNEIVNKKNRNGVNTKGGKNRLKHGTLSNNSSVEASGSHSNAQSDYSSQDNSTEHFTDQNGVDLLQFFKITLNKNTKDRYMLLRIEKELAALAQDQSYVIFSIDLNRIKLV